MWNMTLINVVEQCASLILDSDNHFTVRCSREHLYYIYLSQCIPSPVYSEYDVSNKSIYSENNGNLSK